MQVLLTGNTTFKLANFREGLIRRLINEGHQVIIVAPPDEYVDKIRAIGCEFIPLKMDRNGTSPFAEARLLYTIYKTFRRLRPDIVFGYTIKNNIYSGMSCRLLNIPFAPNVTGLGPAFNGSGLINGIVKILYRVAFSAAHIVFFQNKSDLKTFTNSSMVSEDRIRLLPGSGVDVKRFELTPLPDNTDSIRFLMVARLLYDKGVEIYINAARKVRKLYPQARFQLLGPLDPDSRSGITQAQLDEWIAEGEIDYLGAVQNVLPFLQSCHCLVLPSYYHEGTPRTLLEGGAIGRPIITTDMPGCRDVIVDQKTGFIIAPRSVEELVEGCGKFLTLSAEEQNKMGTNSHRRIFENYDEEIVIRSYMQILDELNIKRDS